MALPRPDQPGKQRLEELSGITALYIKYKRKAVFERLPSFFLRKNFFSPLTVHGGCVIVLV